MAKVVLAFFGLLALVMGSVFSWIGWSSRQEALKAAVLKSLTWEALQEGEVGRSGYVEGELTQRNDTQLRDLVLYTRSRLQGFSKKDGSRVPIWQQMERLWPALWVGVGDGEVRASGGYSLVLLGSDPVYTSTQELEVMVTERYEGLRVGQVVTALGQIDEDFRGRFLATKTVASGSYADYLQNERGSAVFGLVSGGVLLLVGLILLLIALAL